MSDLFFGGSMSECFRLVSGGAAYNLNLNFQPDKVEVYNLTQWTNTAGNLPYNVWFRNDTAAAESYQQQVIDSAAAQSFNFLNPQTNGFTVADVAAGETSYQKSISGATAADPVVITTSAAHGYQSDQIVRITDLGSDMPTARGMDQLNNNRYKITVLSSTTFSLQDPVSGEDIDGSAFTAYVSGGRVNLESRVLQLNNPQVDPYSNSSPYNPNPFSYDEAQRILTLGSEVIGDDGDVLQVHSYKFGRYVDLGDIG